MVYYVFVDIAKFNPSVWTHVATTTNCMDIGLGSQWNRTREIRGRHGGIRSISIGQIRNAHILGELHVTNYHSTIHGINDKTFLITN